MCERPEMKPTRAHGPCRIRVKELTKTGNSGREKLGFAAIVYVWTAITESSIDVNLRENTEVSKWFPRRDPKDPFYGKGRN